MNWWVTSAWSLSPMYLVAWVFWVIFSICLHELAHGWAAIRQGDDTPVHTGHMTWNPMVHMGPTALIMFALFGFTWGAMPVDRSRFRSRYGDALVSFAGPACNLLQCAILLPLLILWNVFADRPGVVDENFFKNMQIFLFVGAGINLLGFLFNLIPIPPLDGWWIVCDFYRPYQQLWQGDRGAVLGLISFVLLFMFFGGKVFAFAFGTVAIIQDLSVGVLQGLLG